MAKKKKHEEHENHERWLVSYADFITLLFAFFTSMYAISSVNEGKFRVLSESLAMAFNPTLYTAQKKNEGPRFIKEQKSSPVNENDIYTNRYEKIKTALQELEKNKRLSMIADGQKLTIRISEGILFRGGDEFQEEGLPVLDEIAEILKDMPNSVKIEGHTDNIPTSTLRFPSNWELSSARALKILKYFISAHRYDPRKLAATGYGEYRPITSNDTPEGRAKNRRVDILVINENHMDSETYRNPDF